LSWASACGELFAELGGFGGCGFGFFRGLGAGGFEF
jgi:hypothetical protein